MAMAKFDVGDLVAMPDIPITVQVLEIGVCKEGDDCPWPETFRFTDPGGLGDDWEHTYLFELAAARTT